MAGSPGEVKPASSMAPEHPVAVAAGWVGGGTFPHTVNFSIPQAHQYFSSFPNLVWSVDQLTWSNILQTLEAHAVRKHEDFPEYKGIITDLPVPSALLLVVHCPVVYKSFLNAKQGDVGMLVQILRKWRTVLTNLSASQVFQVFDFTKSKMD